MQQLGELLYLQIYASLHLIQLPTNVAELLRYHRLLQSAAVLEWVAIFSAKISLLLFFRKLVDRTYRLKVFWTVIMVLVSILGCVCIPLGFLVCSDFSIHFLSTAPSVLSDKSLLTDMKPTALPARSWAVSPSTRVQVYPLISFPIS
jgi:hypothetical protein